MTRRITAQCLGKRGLELGGSGLGESHACFYQHAHGLKSHDETQRQDDDDRCRGSECLSLTIVNARAQ